MKIALRFVCLLFGGLLVACTEAPIDREAEAERLMQASRDWSALVSTGQYEAALDVWADDGFMLPPDAPILQGKAAIAEYVQGAASIPGFTIRWEPLHAEISTSGDLGYLIERNVIEMDGEDGEKIVIHGKATTVWRKNLQGEWKNVVDMWSPIAPAGTSPDQPSE